MGAEAVISKLSEILKSIKTRRKRRLYEQWIERAELPLPLLYMLLGASLVIVLACSILLALYSY